MDFGYGLRFLTVAKARRWWLDDGVGCLMDYRYGCPLSESALASGAPQKSWYLIRQAHETSLSQAGGPYTCGAHLPVRGRSHASSA
ncbi:hypothetical protein SO802_002063 [Lithocarpus litseifolius]|uniref:Uncharacterized protein n=1 Tax=Lithocarpus litseifolius TaxID=425828 RepID=A0AAW2DZX3_9ROSI